MRNDSTRKCSGMLDYPSGKIAEGMSVMWGTRLRPMDFSTNLGCFTKYNSALELTYAENDVESIHFISSCRKWFNN